MPDPVGAPAPKTHEIKTKKQGVIKYTLNEGGTLEYKERSNGRIDIYAKGAKIMLPENTASNIKIGGGESLSNKLSGGFYYNAEDVEIIDGKEKGLGYADQVEINGDNVTFTAARKEDAKGNPSWAKDASKGDEIYVAQGQDNRVNANSGNNVLVSSGAVGTRVEAYQGTKIKNAGFGTLVDVKKSPHMGKEATASVDIKSELPADVKAEKGTLTIADGPVAVQDPSGKDVTRIDNDGPSYYKF